MQTFQNLFSVLSWVARPFHLVDARSVKRGLALAAIGAFFVATLAAFSLSASSGGGSGTGLSAEGAEKVGFQPGQEVASLLHRGYIGR